MEKSGPGTKEDLKIFVQYLWRAKEVKEFN